MTGREPRPRIRAVLRRPDPGTTPWSGPTGPIRILRSPLGSDRILRSPLGSDRIGAKVDGVALGLSAFGVVTADAAALGFWAFGLTEEAGALGLIRLGPVWAGREPGVGTYTPCAMALVAMMKASQATLSVKPNRSAAAIAPSNLGRR